MTDEQYTQCEQVSDHSPESTFHEIDAPVWLWWAIFALLLYLGWFARSLIGGCRG